MNRVVKSSHHFHKCDVAGLTEQSHVRHFVLPPALFPIDLDISIVCLCVSLIPTF